MLLVQHSTYSDILVYVWVREEFDRLPLRSSQTSIQLQIQTVEGIQLRTAWSLTEYLHVWLDARGHSI